MSVFTPWYRDKRSIVTQRQVALLSAKAPPIAGPVTVPIPQETALLDLSIKRRFSGEVRFHLRKTDVERSLRHGSIDREQCQHSEVHATSLERVSLP